MFINVDCLSVEIYRKIFPIKEAKVQQTESASQSIELITIDSDPNTILRVAQQWLRFRPQRVRSDQRRFIEEGLATTTLLQVVLEIQDYKVERIRRDMTTQLRELSASTHPGYVEYEKRSERIWLLFGPRDWGNEETLLDYHTRVICAWRNLRKEVKNLRHLTGAAKEAAIKELFRTL